MTEVAVPWSSDRRPFSEEAVAMLEPAAVISLDRRRRTVRTAPEPHAGRSTQFLVARLLSMAGSGVTGPPGGRIEPSRPDGRGLAGRVAEFDASVDDEATVQKAVITAEALAGPRSCEVAEHCEELAGLLIPQGELHLAGCLYEEALSIKRGILGSRATAVAITLNNLAAIRELEGLDDEADSLWAEARALLERSAAAG